jgi:hypothetical protein
MDTDSPYERIDRDVPGRARIGGGREGGVGDQHGDRADPPRTALRHPQAPVLVATARNPLRLPVQQGPVLPMVNEVQAFRFTRIGGVL